MPIDHDNISEKRREILKKYMGESEFQKFRDLWNPATHSKHVQDRLNKIYDLTTIAIASSMVRATSEWVIRHRSGLTRSEQENLKDTLLQAAKDADVISRETDASQLQRAFKLMSDFHAAHENELESLRRARQDEIEQQAAAHTKELSRLWVSRMLTSAGGFTLLILAYWAAEEAEVALPLKMYSPTQQDERTAAIVKQIDESIETGFESLSTSISEGIETSAPQTVREATYIEQNTRRVVTPQSDTPGAKPSSAAK